MKINYNKFLLKRVKKKFKNQRFTAKFVQVKLEIKIIYEKCSTKRTKNIRNYGKNIDLLIKLLQNLLTKIEYLL